MSVAGENDKYETFLSGSLHRNFKEFESGQWGFIKYMMFTTFVLQISWIIVVAWKARRERIDGDDRYAAQ